MTRSNAALLFLALAVCAGTAWQLLPRLGLLAPDQDEDTAGPAATRQADGAEAQLAIRPRPGDPRPASGGPGRIGPVDDFLTLLARGTVEERQAAAAALRHAARTDDALRADAFRRLLDPQLDSTLRAALALVLGTIAAGDVDAGLLRAIQQFRDDPAFVRSAILGIGAQREPATDDEVFDLGDRPHGVEGPAGLGITVRRVVADRDVRAALLPHLEAEASDVREAVVLCLRQSLVHPDVRIAFRQVLDQEESDDVAAPLGEALAVWALRASPNAQADVVDGLVGRAATDGFDAYRFRLEDDLARLPLTDRARADLLDLSRSDTPFALRSFALTVLASHAGRAQEAATGEIRVALLAALTESSDAASRDLGARLARNLPYEAALVKLLARIAAKDPAWNVRYSALDTLATYGAREDVILALRQAGSDPDERVRERSAEALVALQPR